MGQDVRLLSWLKEQEQAPSQAATQQAGQPTASAAGHQERIGGLPREADRLIVEAALVESGRALSGWLTRIVQDSNSRCQQAARSLMPYLQGDEARRCKQQDRLQQV